VACAPRRIVCVLLGHPRLRFPMHRMRRNRCFAMQMVLLGHILQRCRCVYMVLHIYLSPRRYHMCVDQMRTSGSGPPPRLAISHFVDQTENQDLISRALGAQSPNPGSVTYPPREAGDWHFENIARERSPDMESARRELSKSGLYAHLGPRNCDFTSNSGREHLGEGTNVHPATVRLGCPRSTYNTPWCTSRPLLPHPPPPPTRCWGGTPHPAHPSK
jgi:hypothetical protein